MRRLITFFITTWLIFLLLARSFVPASIAEITYEISGNGEGSTNTTTSDQTQTTAIEQTNIAQIENNITVNADTGNNSASDNSGGATIQTGDTQVAVSVQNSANSNIAQQPCCPDTENATISQNGSNSTNTIALTSSTTSQVTSTNDSTIINNVNIAANTGKNQASSNTGNIVIDTGNISVGEGITNVANLSQTNLSVGDPGGTFSIWGNGFGSSNSIVGRRENSIQISDLKSSLITNNTNFYLETGGNIGNGNLGDVIISTGDVIVDLEIENVTNQNLAKITCCQATPTPPPSPSPTPTPTSPPTGGGGGDGGGGGGGGGAGGNVAAGGPSQVIGLAVTSGDIHFLSYILYILSLLCFLISLKLIKGQLPALAHLGATKPRAASVRLPRLSLPTWQIRLSLEVTASGLRPALGLYARNR